MKLTLNFVTRGRPELIRETVARTLKNVSLPTTTVMVSVDDDDEPTREALKALDNDCLISVRPREDTLGAKVNRCMREAPADVYLVGVDYAAHITPGFDAKVCEAAALFPDGIGLVSGPLANLSFPCAQAVTARFAEINGGVWPEYFPYWFGDHWIDDVARMIGRLAYADIRLDYQSRRPGNTIGLREPGFWATLYDALYVERACIAQKMLDAMWEPEWREKVLISGFELIRQRSTMINNGCRGGDKQIEQIRGAEPADERYQRVRAKGERLLLDILSRLEAADTKAVA